MTDGLEIAQERMLAERAIAAAEAKMLAASADPFAFQRARDEHDAARREAERVEWAAKRAARDAEAAEAAKIRAQVDRAVASANATMAETAQIVAEIEPLIEALAGYARRLRDLHTACRASWDAQIWASGRGLIERAIGGSALAIPADVVSRAYQIASELAKAAGTNPSIAQQRAAQQKDL